MDENIAIKIENISKSFKLPHNKSSSVKSAFINIVKGGDRSYETLEALKDVSFDIKKGEFFGIVGRNGSGKSTLLKLLAGIYTPTKGNIEVVGKLTPFIELGVGFSPELTGRENVFLNGALLGFTRREMQAMYKDIVDFAELHRFMDQKLKNYSSGMQVRLAFSIAIRVQTDILVLDEVLAVGDEAFQQKCKEYFRELKNGDQTAILVTHDMKSVIDYCDRAVLIDNGELKMIQDPNTVAEAYEEINRQVDSTSLVASSDTVSNGAELMSVSISNSAGTEKSFFKYSDNIEITAKYKLHKTIEEATIDIGLKLGTNGPYYFYTNSYEHEQTINGKKGQVIEATLKLKNIFSEGTYYIATSLYDKPTSTVYARDRQAAKLTTEALPAGGLVYPEHHFSINNHKSER